jgi:DNA primase small subunit
MEKTQTTSIKKHSPLIEVFFHNYYRNHARFEVDAVERQEFALQPFSGGMVRHKAFKTLEELKKFIIEKAPRHIA